MGQLVRLGRRVTAPGAVVLGLRKQVRRTVGKILHALRLPGMVQPFEYQDRVKGWAISLRPSDRYTILNVDRHDYFFDRDSGAFDGTGAGAWESCVS